VEAYFVIGMAECTFIHAWDTCFSQKWLSGLCSLGCDVVCTEWDITSHRTIISPCNISHWWHWWRIENFEILYFIVIVGNPRRLHCSL